MFVLVLVNATRGAKYTFQEQSEDILTSPLQLQRSVRGLRLAFKVRIWVKVRVGGCMLSCDG